MFKIYPKIFIRTSSISIEDFKLYQRKQKQLHNLNHFNELSREAFEKLTNEISIKLYNEIKSTNNIKMKRKLLQLKRDVFNSKNIKFRSNEIRPEIKTLLDIYVQHLNLLSKQEIKLKEKYDEILNLSKLNVLKLTSTNEFKKGLAISSKDLYIESEKNVSVLKTKKYNQLVNGLNKYLTRVISKTSPFSTFTSIGYLSNSNLKSGNQQTKNSSFYNYKVYDTIFKCLICINFTRNQLYLELNPTIKVNEKYKYYHQNNGNEVFQEMEFNDFVDFIYNNLSNSKLKFIQLKDILIKEFKIKSSKLDSYLINLYSLGFINFKLENKFNNSICIEEKFIACAKIINFDKELRDFFQLRIEIEKRITHSDKFKLLETIYNSFNNIIKKLLLLSNFNYYYEKNSYIVYYNDVNLQLIKRPLFTLDILKFNEIIIENTRKDCFINLPNIEFNNTFLKLANLYDKLWGYLDYESFNYTSMEVFFKKQFSTSKSVSLLDFYEKYCKEGFKFIIDNNKDYDSKIISSIFKKIESSDETVLNFITRNIKTTVNIESYSVSANIQFQRIEPLSEKSKCLFFIESIYTGYGRIFNRYYRLFEKDFIEEINRNNKELSTSSEIILNLADNLVNTYNVYEDVLDFYLSESGENMYHKAKFFGIENLNIRFNKRINRLVVYNKKTRKNVRLIDLSLYTHNKRNNLFKMLLNFSGIKPLHSRIHLASYLGKNIKKSTPYGTIVIIPKIIIDEVIVIQRKSWQISNLNLPRNIEKSYKYYFEIKKWQLELGIPNEVFLKSKEPRIKPQYINFESVLLFEVFVDWFLKNNTPLIIEEMNPDTAGMSLINGKKMATEITLQWDCNK